MTIEIKLNTDNDAFFSANPNYKINPSEIVRCMDKAKASVMELVNTNYEYTNRILDANGNYVGSIKIKCDKILEDK